MRDDIVDNSLKMALSNGMQGPKRDRMPAVVARTPELMRRLANVIEDQDTSVHWGFLVQLYDAASAIVAAKKATEAVDSILKKELDHGR